MSSTAEQPRNLTDPFEIGVYAMEVMIVAAIIYAMIVLPMWLKPMTL